MRLLAALGRAQRLLLQLLVLVQQHPLLGRRQRQQLVGVGFEAALRNEVGKQALQLVSGRLLLRRLAGPGRVGRIAGIVWVAGWGRGE